jgi:hypothetical protein
MPLRLQKRKMKAKKKLPSKQGYGKTTKAAVVALMAAVSALYMFSGSKSAAYVKLERVADTSWDLFTGTFDVDPCTVIDDIEMDFEDWYHANVEARDLRTLVTNRDTQGILEQIQEETGTDPNVLGSYAVSSSEQFVQDVLDAIPKSESGWKALDASAASFIDANRIHFEAIADDVADALTIVGEKTKSAPAVALAVASLADEVADKSFVVYTYVTNKCDIGYSRLLWMYWKNPSILKAKSLAEDAATWAKDVVKKTNPVRTANRVCATFEGNVLTEKFEEATQSVARAVPLFLGGKTGAALRRVEDSAAKLYNGRVKPTAALFKHQAEVTNRLFAAAYNEGLLEDRTEAFRAAGEQAVAAIPFSQEDVTSAYNTGVDWAVTKLPACKDLVTEIAEQHAEEIATNIANGVQNFKTTKQLQVIGPAAYKAFSEKEVSGGHGLLFYTLLVGTASTGVFYVSKKAPAVRSSKVVRKATRTFRTMKKKFPKFPGLLGFPRTKAFSAVVNPQDNNQMSAPKTMVADWVAKGEDPRNLW